MLNAEQENAYLDQAIDDYYNKKHGKINKKVYKNVPNEIIVHMWI